MAFVALVILGPQVAPVAPAGSGCGAPGAPPVSSADARPDSISADRPDLTDATDVVGARRIQIETGLSFTGDRQDELSQRQFVAPLAMVRVGIGDRFEARLSTDGVVTDRIAVGGTDTRVTGGSDLQLGAKWRLFERRCFVVGVEPLLSLPTGSTPFTSGGYDPALKVLVDRTFPHGISLSANLVLTSATEAGRRFTHDSESASLGYPVVSGWSGFAELYHASLSDSRSMWIVDAGAAHPIGSRAQIDVIVGRGLSDAAPDWFVGAGFAIRLSTRAAPPPR